VNVERLRSRLSDPKVFWATSMLVLALYILMKKSLESLNSLDSAVHDWVSASIGESEAVRVVAREGLAFFGHFEFAIAMGVIMLVSLWSRGFKFEGVLSAFTLLSSWIIIRMMKINLTRERPDYALDFMESYAWPSGHVTISVVLVGLILFVWLPRLADGSDTAASRLATRITRPQLIGWLFIGIPILTAAGRIVGGVHWFTDTLAGLMTGLALLSASLWLHEKLPAANRQSAGDESE